MNYTLSNIGIKHALYALKIMYYILLFINTVTINY